MSARGRRGLYCICIIGVCLLVHPEVGTADTPTEIILPEEVFYYRPVASVFGQSAVWNNPAALGNAQSGTMFMFTHRAGELAHGWGLASNLQGFGIGYRHIDGDGVRDHNEYIFSLAGGEATKFGLSYQYIKNGPGPLNRRHLWNFSISSKRSRNFALGARVENFNRTEIRGEKSDIRFVYGIATRLRNDLLTVSFDVDQTNKESFNSADYRTGLEVRPRPGLYLFADFDNHSRFNIGLRVNLGSSFGGHYHEFDGDSDSRFGTTYIGYVRGRQPSIAPQRRRTLHIRAESSLPEVRDIPLFRPRPLRFFDYVWGIYRAADDPSVDGIFLDISNYRAGLAKTEELRNAVEYFRKQGKTVTAYLAEPNNLGYLLACSADRVVIPPVSSLDIVGVRATLTSYKGLMEKIGVEAEMERVGAYKSAPERFMYEKPTEEHRQQINHLLDSIYAQVIDMIASSRSLPPDSVRALIDSAPLVSVDARDAGLVDTLLYHNQALSLYASSGSSFWGRERVGLDDYLKDSLYTDRWGRKKSIAVVIADGDITGGGSSGKVGGYDMVKTIRQARENPAFEGIVLRLNSPGGEALASDLIWHEVEKSSQSKPLVVSMGNIAASGAYYIASVNSPIFLDRGTITGSIGVYAGKVNLADLYDKLGVYKEMYTRGENADFFSWTKPYTEEQRAKLKGQLKRFYAHFTELVGEARSLSPDSVDALGRGRVWTGPEAISYGLADTLGGVRDAVQEILDRTGLTSDEIEIVTMPERKYLFKNPFDIPGRIIHTFGNLLTGSESHEAGILEAAHDVYFRLPFELTIE